MLQKVDVNDTALNQSKFMTDEVQYNLIHLICGSGTSRCLKTVDDKLIFAQSEGHNGWLWLNHDIAEDRKDILLHELVDAIEGTGLPGVSGDPSVVERFVKIYAEKYNFHSHPHMAMESYYCPEVKKPLDVRGTMRQATRGDVAIVADFLAGFSEGAYGVTVDPASQIPASEWYIDNGGLYLWIVNEEPVSMANIAHRSPRHARINAVYTPSAFRKRGYASAVVAELCWILQFEGLVAMLYADLKNPDSNKVYQNIGFVKSGKIADIKFKAQ
ncbi:GNAT family N-acetyltransferase [Paenibacillus sp. GSMTC-2017]|uniref:GNAT family N-acetyltransferase n=1 Tax=Paenibacillus sp. GSMTC-2017 TaxID=2794350 RepID=UPI0018D7D628|nr:GNAT family N-acetyltransferase [Paenibacillus sp. GSMTC-2017]MBH5319482.1 GNAT family N-acetyltransferase [Paenibacillus sp. GSMTC-2017]